MLKEWLLSFFNEVRPWSFFEGSLSRKVWIECIGLPIFAWSFDNISKVGGSWGIVLGYSVNIVEINSFGNAYILIDTYIKSFIKGWVLLEMGKISCDLYVKETFRDLCCEFISAIQMQEDLRDPCSKASHEVFKYNPVDNEVAGLELVVPAQAREDLHIEKSHSSDDGREAEEPPCKLGGSAMVSLGMSTGRGRGRGIGSRPPSRG